MSDLSGQQFNIERQLFSLSGGTSDIQDRVRGIQRRTSNVYRPSFSADYRTVRSMKSSAAAGQPEEGEEEGGEEE